MIENEISGAMSYVFFAPLNWTCCCTLVIFAPLNLKCADAVQQNKKKIKNKFGIMKTLFYICGIKKQTR